MRRLRTFPDADLYLAGDEVAELFFRPAQLPLVPVSFVAASFRIAKKFYVKRLCLLMARGSRQR